MCAMGVIEALVDSNMRRESHLPADQQSGIENRECKWTVFI